MIGFALIIRKRKGRVFAKLDVALDQQGLATAALAFLAAVHERHALAECGLQDGFAFLDLHFDTDRLEAHDMGACLRHCEVSSVSGAGSRPWGATSGSRDVS